MKCEVGGQQKHCTATTGQTRGTQSQVAYHSAEGSNVAEGRQEEDRGGPSVDSNSSESSTDENTPRTPTNPNNKEPSRRTERKEVVAGKQRSGPKQKQRREREIKQLVKRRFQWKKASREEKKGLKPLWEEVKKNLEKREAGDYVI